VWKSIAERLPLAESSFRRFLFLGVDPTEMNVKHLAQKLFAFEGIACEVESNGMADRAGTIQEIIFWLGRYDQLRFAHTAIIHRWSESETGYSNKSPGGTFRSLQKPLRETTAGVAKVPTETGRLLHYRRQSEADDLTTPIE
jgi:hypothetical protein